MNRGVREGCPPLRCVGPGSAWFGKGARVTSIERTAYPQFKRLTSARVLHVFFTPTAEEIAWARERTKEPAALFALVLDLKCFQKMARFCSRDEIPDVVVDHVRRCLELVGLDYWIWPGRPGGLGSSLSDLFGRLPAWGAGYNRAVSTVRRPVS